MGEIKRIFSILVSEPSKMGDRTKNYKFKPVSSHHECTHLLIEDENEKRLSTLSLINNKLYALYYDNEEDEYYVINENGDHCYSVDAVVLVKMLKFIE